MYLPRVHPHATRPAPPVSTGGSAGAAAAANDTSRHGRGLDGLRPLASGCLDPSSVWTRLGLVSDSSILRSRLLTKGNPWFGKGGHMPETGICPDTTLLSVPDQLSMGRQARPGRAGPGRPGQARPGQARTSTVLGLSARTGLGLASVWPPAFGLRPDLFISSRDVVETESRRRRDHPYRVFSPYIYYLLVI